MAKYGPDGALLWATQAGGSALDFGVGIATSARGDSYVTGNFAGTATFGEGEPNETSLTATGSSDRISDIFVAKYGPDGALQWATQAGGSAQDFGVGIATSARGDSYVTGNFAGTATFGEGEPNETSLTSAGSIDIFMAKYGPDGALLWATRAGGSVGHQAPPGAGGLDEVFGIATSARGDSYVTGFFTDTATFGEGEPNETTLTATGSGDRISDIFVAKYGPDGALQWATQAGGGDDDGVGGDDDAGYGIATSARGDSYVTGSFEGTATFGEGEPNETELSSGGIFVAKYGSRPNGHGPVAHRWQSPCDPRGATPGGPRPGRC